MTQNVYNWISALSGPKNKMFSINRLNDDEILGLANEINGVLSTLQKSDTKKLCLPTLVVVGTQSSGKSTLLNTIINLNILPTGKNMVTKTPLNITTYYIPDDGVTIQFGDYNVQSGLWDKIREFKFQNHLLSKPDVDAIQAHIESYTKSLVGNTMNISSKPIYMKIYSNNVPNLTLVDLPGLVMVPQTDKGQPSDIREQIEKLIISYISKPNTIPLLVMQAKSDLETDLGMALIKSVGKIETNNNTIGVLTKPDLMNPDTNISEYLTSTNISKDLALEHGYHVVKNYIGNLHTLKGELHTLKGYEESQETIIEKTIQEETKYFTGHSEYQKSIYSNKIGYNSLIGSLVSILTRSIKNELPGIMENIIIAYENVSNRLDELGYNIPKDNKEMQLRELNQYINDFTKVLDDSIESRGQIINIGKNINDIFDEFRYKLQMIKLTEENNLENIKKIISAFESYHMHKSNNPITILEGYFTSKENIVFENLQELIIYESLHKISQSVSNGIINILKHDRFEKYGKLTQRINQIAISEFIANYEKSTAIRLRDMLNAEKSYIWTESDELNQYILSSGKSSDPKNIINLINIYIDSIKKHIKHFVPKYIICFFIRNIQHDMSKKLMGHIMESVENDNLYELFEADDHVENERNELADHKNKLDRIILILKKNRIK